MVTILKGIVVKIYPNKDQIQKIEQNIGDSRFTWNHLLNICNERYINDPRLPSLTAFDMNNMLPSIKEEFDFLRLSESSSLQYVSEKLREAFARFFKGQRGHPRFKSKKTSRSSYTVKRNSNNIVLEQNRIKLPKLDWVKARWSNMEFDKIQRVTIKRHPSGKYTASVLVWCESQALAKTGKSIGLDMGQIDLMIGSDGTVVETRLHEEYNNKLIHWQKKASRRARLAKERDIPLREARNYQKAKQMVAKYHEKISDCRADYLHKITTNLVKEYDFVVVEDLQIKNMMRAPKKNKRIRAANHRKIANQSWGIAISMLEYKCEWYNKTFAKVSPRYTTQECSICHERTGPKNDVSIREWTCNTCHAHNDRDINAAINILNRGLKTATTI